MVNYRAQTRQVLLDTLYGELNIEDFHRRWPTDVNDRLLDVIYEETEDTIEHTPGPLFRHGSAEQSYRQAMPYKILIVDAELLSDDFADVPSERLVEIRQRLLKDVDLRQEHAVLAEAIRDRVRREVSSDPN